MFGFPHQGPLNPRFVTSTKIMVKMMRTNFVKYLVKVYWRTKRDFFFDLVPENTYINYIFPHDSVY